MKKIKNKSKFITILLLCMLFVGFSILLYPTFANYINSKHQSKVVASYNDQIELMSEKEYEDNLYFANEYNNNLVKLLYPLSDYDDIEGYDDSLNAFGNGMMGYISIPKLQIELPIYHGTSDKVLQNACGHVEGTSLPIGGESTHCVLSAHRGLPSSKLFTDLDKMEIGDIFSISVLGYEIMYRVDQIKTVVPTDVKDLTIVDGMDYCTLMTCTPYGINTHRLLVRGVRIDTEDQVIMSVRSEAYLINKFVVAATVAIPILLILILYVCFKPAKVKLPENMKEGND